MNPYITALKTMSERLEADPAVRGYKLLHENPQHHNPRTYNRSTLDEVAVAWEGDVNDPMGMPEARDVLIEAQSGDRYSVPYWHPAYMPLRYPLIFPFGEQSWHSNIPNAGGALGGSLLAHRNSNNDAPSRVARGKGGSKRVTLASFYRSTPLYTLLGLSNAHSSQVPHANPSYQIQSPPPLQETTSALRLRRICGR